MIEFNSQAMNKALKLYIRMSVEYQRIVGSKHTDNVNAKKMRLLRSFSSTTRITNKVIKKIIAEKRRPAII